METNRTVSIEKSQIWRERKKDTLTQRKWKSIDQTATPGLITEASENGKSVRGVETKRDGTALMRVVVQCVDAYDEEFRTEL